MPPLIHTKESPEKMVVGVAHGDTWRDTDTPSVVVSRLSHPPLNLIKRRRFSPCIVVHIFPE